MKGANLVQVLASTLNPSTTHSSLQTLSEMKAASGFAVQLLIISDDANYDISIRQSALIYLKNLISEHCDKDNLIPQSDINTLKDSLLEALIRNVNNRKLTPTFREIIFLMAQRYYPREWSQVVDQAVGLLEKSGDLSVLLGTVETLKAIYSVFGGSISKEIELNNLCNKSILPILTLASRLLQNFSHESSTILVGIFKLLSTSIQFHLPKIIELNIHSFMIFVKKILDLNADLTSHQNANIYMLKKISLRILYRVYQRHANLKITENRQFAQQFHMKYTGPFVQTLILQTLLKPEGDKTASYRVMQLIKISLSCLGYINRQNVQAAKVLVQHRDGILKICMDKFRIPLSRSYQSFNDFKLYTQETRHHFKEFILSLIQSEALPQYQVESTNSILGLLLEYLQKGDKQQKELALYLFTQISTQLKYLKESVDEKMIAVLFNYVQPLLKEDQDLLIRVRACQMIESYHYLDFPQDKIKDMAMLIYSCLLVGSNEKQIFLKICACNAFNSIMKYDNIVEFIRPYLQDILRIYTSMLQTDTSIIKNFEDLINLLQQQIAPFANDLASLLIGMFLNYTSQNPQTSQQGYQTLEKEEKDEDQEEDQPDQQQDMNNEYNAKACISSIRQVLQVGNSIVSQKTQQQLLEIIVYVFSEPNQNYLEEGYNILNLLLYKTKDHVNPQYFLFFKVIVYAILGLPPGYIKSLNDKGDNFNLKFAQILQNICVQPDNDIIENSIGCLRNFIAKSSGQFLRNQIDELNTSVMDYILKLVPFVHQNQNQKASQTDRLIILTIYITLIEYQTVNQYQLNEIINKVTTWMQMEYEAVQQERIKSNTTGFMTFGKNLNTPKYTYTPVYIQILLLAVNFYDKVLQINITNVVQRAIVVADQFKCDYELSRVIVGFSHILNNKLVGEEGIVKAMLNSLPEFVRRLCKLRQQGDSPENDREMDDEAEQQQVFGEDQNTHIGWQGSKPSDKEMLLKKESDQQEDNDWQQEFNKFYESPLQKMDELKYLEAALTANAHIYATYMSRESQDSLSLYLANAPPKS